MNILNKKVFLVFLLFFSVSFFALPQNCFADSSETSEYLELSEKDAKNLMKPLIQGSIDSWTAIAGLSQPEEEAILKILENSIRYDQIKFWLSYIPAQTAKTIVKGAIKIAPLVASSEISVVLDKIEKMSVEQAVKYGENWLLQNQIRKASGVLTDSYETYSKTTHKPVFQFIIIYKPKNKEIRITIYSPNSVDPPHPTRKYQWIGNGGKPIDPFIVNISGKAEKEKSGQYKWTRGPNIDISFPEDVPDLGIKPLSFWEKQKKGVENELKKKKIVLTQFLKWVSSETNVNVEGIWAKIKDTISNIDLFGGAALVETPILKDEKLTLTEDFPEIFSETESSASVEPETEPQPEVDAKFQSEDKSDGVGHNIGQTLSKDEIEEELKGILEEVDKISQEVKELVGHIEEKLVDAEDMKDKEEEETVEEDEETEIELAKSTVLCDKKFGNSPVQNKVIINEVAWMGTKNSSNDEWIELKNLTNSTISLEGWQLIDKKQQIKIVFTAGEAIPAGGFLFLERTDDDSVPNIDADLIYTGALSNSNEALYLFNENCQLQDEVLADSKWPAGNNSEKRTMERANNLTWHSYCGPHRAGIFGTPKAGNSFAPMVFAGSGGGGGSSASEPEPEIQYCSQENLSLATSLFVVLNEIAWMGTATSSNDEWIELKNVSDQDVSLEGWQILDKDEQIKIVFSAGEAIPAGGFLLLERTDDDSVPDITADLIYVGGLNNQDETLRLFDQNCNLIDEIQATSTWSAGDNNEKRTMERKMGLPGWLPGSWQTSQNPGGTPRQENSEIFDGDFVEEETEEEPEPLPLTEAQNVVISEIQLADREFIELYNPLDEDIDISNWYFSYFSSTRDWNEPYRNKNFSEISTSTATTTIIISAKSYFLIGLQGYPEQEGNPNSDWQIYETSQLGNQTGAVGIFSCNPQDATSSEEAMACKIDAVGWGDVIVKEATSTESAPENKSLARIRNSQGNYVDSNNNFQDFEIQEIVSPTNSKGETGDVVCPEPISDLGASRTKNTVVLTWSAPNDPGTLPENFVYEIRYLKNEEISENNWDSASSSAATTTDLTIAISDLYYNSVYYFGVKTFDTKNCSLISNVVSLEIPRMGGILPATGQTSSYDKFDDGFYSAGCNNGYTGNNDGTITDNCTGLIWLKQGQEKMKWKDAIDFCNNLDFASSTDWRLPNYKELYSIVDFGAENAPVIDKNYFNIEPDKYWTSSARKKILGYGHLYYAYGIDFNTRKTHRVMLMRSHGGGEGEDSFYVLPVRGPDGPDVLPITNLHSSSAYRGGDDANLQKGCDSEIQINEDGTKTDTCTNLMWHHIQLDGAYCSWEQAVEHAENSDFAGYTDWRLPNIQELLLTEGICYRGLSGPWAYWSSTAYSLDNNQHWYLDNYNGRGETNAGDQNHFSYHWDIRLLFVRNIDD
ncbi:lamin tail domain-containing protein [Candidatus Parcubacteria bacterium]|nr:lamin tail domain-containing protein [Candidatus Parcubacteria bacterium]